MGHHAAAGLPRRPSDRSPAAPSDLGGFYGAVPYSQCPPNDPGYTAKCDPARGGDPTLSGCNVNSCEPAGCHAYPGNVSTAGLCMHDPELHLRWLQQGALSHVFRTHCEACEIRPWMFPPGWPDLMFRAYHLRAALLPYLCVRLLPPLGSAPAVSHTS